MKGIFALIAFAIALCIGTPAMAQLAAPGSVPPTVITPGPAPGAAGAAIGQAAPVPLVSGQTGQNAAIGAQPQLGTTVFPPVENIVPGSQGAVVFPPAESITGPGGAGQTVLPSPEQTATGSPGGFPFTNQNLSVGVQQDFTQGAVGTTANGVGTTGTGAGNTGLVNPLGSTLNPNQLFTVPGQAAPGQAGSLIQPPRTQEVFLGGNLNQGFSVGGFRSGGAVAAGNLPAVPVGLEPGSRPGNNNWIGADVEPFDADEPDALDFSRSP